MAGREITIAQPNFADGPTITMSNQAFRNRSKTFDISIVSHDSPIAQLENTRITIANLIEELSLPIMYNESITILFYRHSLPDDNFVETEYSFKTKAKRIVHRDEISTTLTATKADLLDRVDEFQNKGSNWLVKEIIRHEFHVNPYKPLRGGSYMKLPPGISRNSKNGLGNIKNDDDKCFLWCHVASLVQSKRNPQRNTKIY